MLQSAKIKSLYGFAAGRLISKQERESIIKKYTYPDKKEKPEKPLAPPINR